MQIQSILYSLPYINLFLFVSLLVLIEISSPKNRQVNNNIIFILLFTLLIFFGLRGFVYTDWYPYYQAYQRIPTWDIFNWDNIYNDWEIGFIIYTVTIKTLGFDYHGWIFINAFIDIIILHYVFKKETSIYTLSFFVFLIYGGLRLEFNLLRNSKTIILFLLSLKYVKEKRFIPYLILNGLGVSFHTSGILYILLYPVLRYRIPKKIFWLVFIIGNALFLFKINYLTSLLTFISGFINERAGNAIITYLSMSQSYGISIGYIERILMFILFMKFYNKIQKNNNKYIYLNIYLAYFTCFFFFSEFNIINERLSILFECSYWLLIPFIYSHSSLKLKKIYLVFFFVYGIFKLISANSMIICKYDNLLFGIDSYELRSYILNRYFI